MAFDTVDELLASDSTGLHDEPPHGVPTTYDWYARSVFHAGGNPSGSPIGPEQTHLTPWGQIYVPETGDYDLHGAKVEIRDLSCWVLKRSTGSWVKTTLSAMNATQGIKWYPEHFNTGLVPPISAPVDMGSGFPRTYPGLDTNGLGRLVHFYPGGARVPIDGQDVCGITVTCRMALVQVNVAWPTPKVLANVGADYYPSSGSTSVRGVGQGRLKWVEQTWRVFGFTTAPGVQLPLVNTTELR